MKQGLRKIFVAASAVFLIGLFVTAAPVRAASTDERIKALEQELNQLKAEQQKVKQEQSLMKADALAAKSKLPSFRYRPGRGLRIRGADRSWEITYGAKFQVQLAFFPGGPRSKTDDSEEGPSQGSMIFRHQEFDFYYKLFGGLYDFGFTWNGRDGRSKSERMQIRFSNWSPYYPDLRLVAISPGTYSPYTRVSSTGGTRFEREPVFDSQFSTGSSKGIALQWGDIPAGPMNIDRLSINYLPGNIAWDDKGARDPVDQKGVVLGVVVDPLAKSKNKYLKGLKMGFSYINARDDINHGGDSRLRVRTNARLNRVTIFQVTSRGRHTYIEPWIGWKGGPWELGYTWARSGAEQDYTGKAGGIDSSDARVTVNNITGRVYVWGPKGFLSGSRNGGWAFSYTHNRVYFDAGGGFDKSHVEGGESARNNEFNSMRRWNYIENVLMLRWYQARNMTFGIEYQINSISKMQGGGDAATARRRLGILSDGGTYQVISMNVLWEF